MDSDRAKSDGVGLSGLPIIYGLLRCELCEIGSLAGWGVVGGLVR